MPKYQLARRRRSGSLWHDVESEVADRVVTYCGREMWLTDAQGRGLDRAQTAPVSRSGLPIIPICSSCGEGSLG